MKKFLTCIALVISMLMAASKAEAQTAYGGFQLTASTLVGNYHFNQTNFLSMGPEVSFRYSIPIQPHYNAAMVTGINAFWVRPLKTNKDLYTIGILVGIDAGWNRFRLTPYINGNLLFTSKVGFLPYVGCDFRYSITPLIDIGANGSYCLQAIGTSETIKYKGALSLYFNVGSTPQK